PITDATPRYMAPELFHGANKTVQSDLYALGIVLYEWLTQTRLQANSYHEWAVLHCQKLNVVLPSSFQVFLPLLSGLLQKQQQSRFSNVHEAINCLKMLST
ncbi:protein kinase domain-containing protein, partial [Acinetobacter baumannii]